MTNEENEDVLTLTEGSEERVPFDPAKELKSFTQSTGVLPLF